LYENVPVVVERVTNTAFLERFNAAHPLPILLFSPLFWREPMLRISKSQFNRVIESNSDLRANLKHNLTAPVQPNLQPESKHTARIILIMFAIMIGLAAGWLGGRVLNGQMSKLPVDATASDTPVDTPVLDGSQPSAETPSSTQQSANRATDVSGDAQRSVVRPLVATEPTPTEPEPAQIPPKPKSVDKDAAQEETTPQDPVKEPVKEIGRQALKKISQDVKGMRRGPANKNENQDHK
jgi:hypothetical protein